MLNEINNHDLIEEILLADATFDQRLTSICQKKIKFISPSSWSVMSVRGRSSWVKHGNRKAHH